MSMHIFVNRYILIINSINEGCVIFISRNMLQYKKAKVNVQSGSSSSSVQNMAPHGVTLRGELRYRDGVKKNIDVHIEGNLTSMIVGIKTLREQVSDLLTELTVQEKGSVAGDKEELGSSGEDILIL